MQLNEEDVGLDWVARRHRSVCFYHILPGKSLNTSDLIGDLFKVENLCFGSHLLVLRGY